MYDYRFLSAALVGIAVACSGSAALAGCEESPYNALPEIDSTACSIAALYYMPNLLPSTMCELRVKITKQLTVSSFAMKDVHRKPKQHICYRGVKDALLDAGLIHSLSQLPGEYAIDALKDIPALHIGFENVISKTGSNPKKAPEGAILVYQWDGVPVPGVSREEEQAGHIEVKTTKQDGETVYCSDFCEAQPITTTYPNLHRKLVAVFVLPNDPFWLLH